MVAHAGNPSYLGVWGRRITWTWEAEVAVNQDHTIALQPGQQEWDFVSKKKTKQKQTFYYYFYLIINDWCIQVLNFFMG